MSQPPLLAPEDATFEQRLKLLLSYDFTVARRLPHVQPNHDGHFMVVDVLDDYGNDEDGNNDCDAWAIVGDDLSALVDEAFEFAMAMFDNAPEALADIMAGGTGILVKKESGT